MKRLLRYALCTLFSLSLLAVNQVSAQSYPFPVNFGYNQGLMPDNYDNSDVQDAYDNWKANYVTSSGACGDRRVIFDYYPGTTRGAEDRSVTVSEGIAYGMLIAAYMGDQSLLDDLWSFYKRNRNGNGVMNWKIKNSCQTIGANGASDAELDVAMALIVASHQWQSDQYLNDAKDMIRVIREKEFEGTILKPGDQFGGASLVCPSYFSPGYYRAFADYDPGYETFWTNAAARGYEIIDAADGTTGLVPDWCNSSGGVGSGSASYEDQGKNFIFDAIRTPFRSGIDYLWYGHDDAKNYCERLSTWLTNNHNSAWDIGSKYGTQLNNNEGAKISPYINNTFVGCFAVGLMGTEMTDKQSFLNQAYDANVQTDPGYGEYFNASFKLLSLLVMTGNFYLPPPDACTAPDLGGDRSLCEGTVNLESGLTDRNFVWKYNGGIIVGANSATYSVPSNKPGVYEVLATDGDGCVRRDKVNVDAATIEPDFIATAGPGNVTVTDNSSGGVSGYSYTVTGGTYAGEEVSTEADFVLDNLPQGSYEICLTAVNDGFGCSDQEQVCKTTVIGDGTGLAIDDFAKANEDAVYAYNLGTSVTPVQKDYCSTQDMLDGAPKVCPVFPCGQLEIECNGTDANPWDGYGVGWKDSDDGPLDLSDVPFMSIRMKATSAVEVGLKFQMGDFSCNAIPVDVTGDYQIFNIDFSEQLTGWDNALEATVTIDAWDAVDAIQILPYNDDVTWTGTVTVDWFIVGAQSIAPPTFATKVDENGFTDYGNYLPEYYPYDSQYDDCTIETEGSACYGAVPDWERFVTMCEASVELQANSCTAENIKWFKDGVQVGSGEFYTALGEGKYIVELSNQGGTYRDSVIVSQGGQPTAAFNYSMEDQGFGVRTYNNSEGFDTWEWSYGATSSNPELAGNETWEEGYMYYDDEGDYDVCLTVNDTVCGNTDETCQTITIECYAPLDEIVGLPDVEQEACPGEVLAFSISDVENASAYGWYGWTPDPLAEDETSVSFEVEVPFWLKVEAYNQCDETVKDSVYINSGVKPEITWDTFEADGFYGSFGHSTTGYPEPGSEDFTWTIDGDVITEFQNEYAMSYTFQAEGDYTVCLTAGYDCEAESGVVESCDIISIVCPLPTKPTFGQAKDQLVYTFTNETMQSGVEYTWLIDGEEQTAETDGSLEYDFVDEGSYEVCLIAGNECVLPGTDAPQTCVTIDASLACVDAPSLGFEVSAGSSDFVKTITSGNSNVDNVAWTVDVDAYTPTSDPFDVDFGTEGTFEVCVTGLATDPGCASPSPFCEDVTTVNTCLTPSVTFSLMEDNGIVSVTTTSNADAYAWTATGSLEGTSSVKNPVFTYDVDGTYSISVVASNDCGADSDPVSKDVDVSICQEVLADFSYSFDGLDVSITNTSENATSYSWSTDEASNVSTDENPVITFSEYGDHTITLSATSACDAATKIVDISLTGGVCNAPVADFDFVVDNVNQEVDVTSTSTDPEGLVLTYEWSALGMYFDSELAENTTANVSVAATQTETYTIILTVTNSCNAASSVSKDVTIIYEEEPVCENEASVSFVATNVEGEVTVATTSSNVDTYSWSAPGATPSSSSVEEPVFMYDANGTYDISVSVTSTDALCDDAMFSASVVVDDIVGGCTTPVTASFTASNDMGVVTITNTSTGASSYSWSAPSASPASSSAVSPVFEYSSNGTYDITLVASSDDALCSDKEVVETVVVNDIVVVTCDEITTDWTSTVSGYTIATTNNSTGSIGGYEWSIDNVLVSSTTSPSMAVEGPGTYNVCLQVSVESGCESEISTPVADCKSVTVEEIDPVNCTGTSPDLGEDVSFCDNPVLSINTALSGRSISWYRDGVFQLELGTSITPTSPGTYSVILKEEGCEYTDTAIVYSSSEVYAGFTGTMNAGTAIFTANTEAGAQTYAWTVDGDDAGSTESITIDPWDSDVAHDVCLTVENGCATAGVDTKCTVVAADATEVSVEPLSITELVASGLVEINPTLVSNYINVEVSELLPSVDVTVFNIVGEVLISTTITESTLMDLSSFATGTYLVTVVTDNGIGTVKIIKE